MAVYPKFKGLNRTYSYRDPQKALPYSERRHLTFRGVDSKNEQKLVTPEARQNRVFGAQKPLN